MAENGWRDRLRAAIKEKETSERAVSLRAGRGPGYVNSLLTSGKEPSIENIMLVCDAVPTSPLYVILGLNAQPGDIEILRALHENPDKRAAILALIGKQQAS